MNHSRFPPWGSRLVLGAASLLLSSLLYWGGLTAWFQRDDFALLSLRESVANGSHSLAWGLFSPLAQGTIRTLSERVFYISFYAVFGTNALSYRVAAFLTLAVAMVLLAEVCAKLTASRTAGYWAAALWAVNSSLAAPLAWTAEYYQLLCALFFLLDFWLLLRFVETGERRYFIAQWVTFLLGFGVLELNVVYPALATVYALCCVPKILRKILPMFVVSAAYMAMHLVVAPLPAAGPYKLYWDWHMAQTLFTYFGWALGPVWLSLVGVHSIFLRLILAAALAAALGCFLIWKLRRREWVALLFPAWFIIALSPLLPLREHMIYEYLTVPSIGLAMWASAAVVVGWHTRGWMRTATVGLLIVYIAASVSIGNSLTRMFHGRSIHARDLFYGLTAERGHFRDRILLLKGVNTEVLENAIVPGALRLAGIREVHVLTEDKSSLETGGLWIDPVLGRQMVAQNRAVVYDVSQGIRDVTAEYRATPIGKPGTLASRVEMGSESYAEQLGPTWYAAEGGYRWMPKHATVTLGGPRSPTERLYINGYCPASVLQAGPLALQVSVDGHKLPLVWVRKGDAAFSFSFDLSADASGTNVAVIDVDLNRSFYAPPDPRELGLAFTSMEIR